MRHLAREKAFQVIYQLDLGDNTLDFALENILEEAELDEEAVSFCRRLAAGVMANRAAIDNVITEHTTRNWKIERMPSVDRNILRLAVYEILYCEDVPDKVAIDEAIEFAKIYSDDKSPKFINSVLDKVLKSKQAE